MNGVKPSEELGDFTTTFRVLPISLMAIVIDYQRIDTALSSPAGNHLGVFAVAVPVIGPTSVRASGLWSAWGLFSAARWQRGPSLVL